MHEPERRKTPRTPPKIQKPSDGGSLATAGLQFGMAIVVFALLGVWLDRKFGTSPWLVLAGVAIGAIGGFYSMYRKLYPPSKPDGK